MNKDTANELIDLHLGPGKGSRGRILALIEEVYGIGYRDGAASMRKVQEAKPARRVTTRGKKKEPQGDETLRNALDALLSPQYRSTKK